MKKITVEKYNKGSENFPRRAGQIWTGQALSKWDRPVEII